MPQIKIGFDRIPIPTAKNFVPLYDIVKGVPLRDSNGQIIVTEDEGPVEALSKAENSTSVVINNKVVENTQLNIVEQFAETSQVSTTLLGIPRAEVQLSLFSDVSTYGVNEEEWEFYQYNGVFGRPVGWYNRRNRTFGNHFYTRLVEETNEQALVVESFPVAFTFPPGPNYTSGGYNPATFARFLAFIDLGNDLYTTYVGSNEIFAKENFLDPALCFTQDGDVEYPDDEQLGYDKIENWCQAWMNMRDGLLLDPNTNTPIRFPTGYDATNTRPGASDTANYFGLLQSKKAYRYQPGRISGFTFGFRASRDEASIDNIIEWGIGNPTDEYVFQIRGPQFNIVRRSTVRLPNEVLQRMGFNNTSQETVTSREPFNESEFSELVITRDFFNGDPLDGNGRSGYLLDPTKVTMYKIEFGWYGAIGAKFYAYIPTDTGDARWVLMHTLTIENQLGEPCLQDPYFKFRYLQDIRNTSSIREPQFLYKYGASCYIDGGDNSAGKYYSYTSDDKVVNNARQTSVAGIYPKREIKNSDGIGKPNKKNVYPVDLKIDCDQLTEVQVVEIDGCPAFGHHYAPSLHSNINGVTRSININGAGNEITTNPQPQVNITNISQASCGIVTTDVAHGYFTGQKVTIENVVGMTEVNLQTYYIEVLSDTEFALYSNPEYDAEVDTSGFAAYVSGGTSDGDPIFRVKDDDSKLIVPGINSCYAARTSESTANIERIGFDELYEKSSTGTIDTQVILNGQLVDRSTVDTSAVRFTSYYDSIAGSTYPITGDGFDCNFLNPVAQEGTQFCEFIIGVTENKPVIVTRNNALGTPIPEIKFLQSDGITEVEPDLDDILYAEFTHSSLYRDRDGYEEREGDAPLGIKYDIDYRLPRPAGTDSGTCSGINVSIEERLAFTVTYSSTDPVSGSPSDVVIFDNEPSELINGFNLVGGEFGDGDSPSGIRFTSTLKTYIDSNNDEKYYADIDGAPSSAAFTLKLSPIRIKDKTITGDPLKGVNKVQIFSFQPKPLYLVVFMRDNAKMNNVTITEYINGTTRAFCPEWVVNSGIDVVFSGGASSGVPAANYLEKERLASTSVDVQNSQPLRPGKLKDTLYVAPNRNNTVALDSVYGPDRTTITPGILNTTATFITARSLENNDVNLVSASVTTKED